MRVRMLSFIVLALLGPHTVAAQSDSALTLDRIFASADFFGARFGPARWLDDGAYTTLERSPTLRGGRDLVRYDATTGARRVLVPAARLVPSGQTRPLGIANYEWSSDGRKLMIFTNTRRVWRANTRGDYWVLDLDTWALTPLGRDAPPSSLMFAKFSPDVTRAAYVSEHDLYVENLRTGAVTRLTTDGSDDIINGTFDWVYEEEFLLRDGFRWSPDGRSIAYWRLDASGVRDFLLINNTDSLYSYVIPVEYPKAGTMNSAVQVGVVPADGGETTWLQIEGDPRNYYLARMEWAGNSDELVVQHVNRLQNTNRVLLASAITGQVRAVLTETDDAWIEVRDDLHWLDDGSRFTWVSERDGWRRAYVVSRDGSQMQPVTPPGVDIVSITLVDESGGWLYYSAAPGDPTHRYLYRARLNGQGEAERVSPDVPGTHGYTLSPDGGFAFHTFSRMGTPPEMDLVTMPEHRTVRRLLDNVALAARVDSLGIPPVEFFQVAVEDGAKLDVWMMRPPGFDPSLTYPVLVYVYGEPWGQTTADRWSGRQFLWYGYLAEQGYLIVSIDNRGTPAPRGRQWRKIVYKQIGVLASQDQAQAIREIARERPYVDSTRVGIWGWSGGGSMTLNAMFRYPEVYQTGMAVAPVPDLRYYDTIYQERYMGLPQDDPDAYTRSSPISFADRLEGNLLIVHGTGDDNVHYQGTEALINRLVEHNKPFQMMAYPNRSHGIFEGRGTTRHLYGLLTRYLLEHLPPGGRTRTAMP